MLRHGLLQPYARPGSGTPLSSPSLAWHKKGSALRGSASAASEEATNVSSRTSVPDGSRKICGGIGGRSRCLTRRPATPSVIEVDVSSSSMMAALLIVCASAPLIVSIASSFCNPAFPAGAGGGATLVTTVAPVALSVPRPNP